MARLYLLRAEGQPEAPPTAVRSEHDFCVTVAGTGVAALAILRERGVFDLLFTDVVMPGGLNGRQLAGVTTRQTRAAAGPASLSPAALRLSESNAPWRRRALLA